MSGWRTTALVASLSDSEGLETLMQKATRQEMQAVVDALQQAYKAGQEDSDARTGRLMARIFGGFIGVTPGVDLDQGDTTPRQRVRSIVKTLASAATSGRR